MTRPVEVIREELSRIEARIDSCYWAFTRQKRGRLAPAEAYRRRTELRAELKAALSVLTKSPG